MKQVLSFVGIAVLSFAAMFGLNYIGYLNVAFFAPKFEGVRRDVMIESRAYSEATTREMYRFKLQYQQAKSDDERFLIRAMVLHESQAFDHARLPLDLRQFVDQLN